MALWGNFLRGLTLVVVFGVFTLSAWAEPQADLPRETRVLAEPRSTHSGSAGTLDPTFGGHGRVFTRIGLAHGLTLQPDGKIIAVGWKFSSPTNQFALARYRPNGTVDRPFGDEGKVTAIRGNGYAVAVRGDGKILVAGQGFWSQHYVFRVARFTPDGNLDPRFGEDGTLFTSIGSDAFAESIALQPDGKIVVAGKALRQFAIARYKPNGTLDPAFGGDGTVTTWVPRGLTDGVTSIALQPDGKIVVTGPTDGVVLVRYTRQGDLDPTFGGDGKVITRIGSAAFATAIALQPDGKIVAAGRVTVDGQRRFAVLRYWPNGTPDRSFGRDGKVLTQFGSGEMAAWSVLLQANGKIIVAGDATVSGHQRATLVRYDGHGRLDPTFGHGGKVSTWVGSRSHTWATVLQPDGRIVVAGDGIVAGRTRMFLARYLGE